MHRCHRIGPYPIPSSNVWINSRNRSITRSTTVLRSNIFGFSFSASITASLSGVLLVKWYSLIIRLGVIFLSQIRDLKRLHLTIFLHSIGEIESVTHFEPLEDIQPAIQRYLPAGIGHNVSGMN